MFFYKRATYHDSIIIMKYITLCRLDRVICCAFNSLIIFSPSVRNSITANVMLPVRHKDFVLRIFVCYNVFRKGNFQDSKSLYYSKLN